MKNTTLKIFVNSRPKVFFIKDTLVPEVLFNKSTGPNLEIGPGSCQFMKKNCPVRLLSCQSYF